VLLSAFLIAFLSFAFVSVIFFFYILDEFKTKIAAILDSKG